mmetsp:Transcript_75209/g.244567  ORF Transcript_75209/g.244567 Transcript_75209/m.244567 type:complete len:235 (+) Transcript_75209:1457-2161(+)
MCNSSSFPRSAASSPACCAAAAPKVCSTRASRSTTVASWFALSPTACLEPALEPLPPPPPMQAAQSPPPTSATMAAAEWPSTRSSCKMRSTKGKPTFWGSSAAVRSAGLAAASSRPPKRCSTRATRSHSERRPPPPRSSASLCLCTSPRDLTRASHAKRRIWTASTLAMVSAKLLSCRSEVPSSNISKELWRLPNAAFASSNSFEQRSCDCTKQRSKSEAKRSSRWSRRSCKEA